MCDNGILWLDVETTGLDCKVNGVIQIAFLLEVNGKVVDKFHSNIKPFDDCVYTEKAEEIHGKSKKEISKYPEESDVMINLIRFLDKNKYLYRYPKLTIAGYNSRFDMDFLIQLFERSSSKYYYFFNYYDKDVYALVKILDISGILNGKVSKKLEPICEVMGVKLEKAHDAMADIVATRKLYKKITKKYLKLI